MTQFLKVSTAVTLALGPFIDNGDGFSAETALTLSQADFRLSKNGAAFAQKSETTSGTHMENGYYSVPFNTTDTDTLGQLRIAVNETGALPVWQDFMIVPANVWDSLFGADQLQVHVNEMTAGIITAAAIATNAIDDDALAADAVTAIQSGLATAAALTTVDDFLDTEIAALITAVGVIDDFLDTEIAALPTAAQIADAVWDEPLTQPAGVFAWAGSFRNLVNWLGVLSRNKILQTDILSTLRNDADDADLATSVTSDDGTTFLRSEWT